jgi:hypothetical protein
MKKLIAIVLMMIPLLSNADGLPVPFKAHYPDFAAEMRDTDAIRTDKELIISYSRYKHMEDAIQRANIRITETQERIDKRHTEDTALSLRPECCVIGMTKEEVNSSNVGTPNDIHLTVVGNQIEEQWVFEHRGYLYFTNGRLTAVQN